MLLSPPPGDPVSATLVKPVMFLDRIVAPKGARLRGRIFQVQTQATGADNLYVRALPFHRIEAGGRSAPSGQVRVRNPQNGGIGASGRGNDAGAQVGQYGRREHHCV